MFSGPKLPIRVQKLLASDCDHAGPSGTLIPLKRQTWHTSLDKCHCRFSCSFTVLSVRFQGHHAFLISDCLNLGKEQTDKDSVPDLCALGPCFLAMMKHLRMFVYRRLCQSCVHCVLPAYTVLVFSLVNKLSLWGFPWSCQHFMRMSQSLRPWPFLGSAGLQNLRR